MGHVCFCPGCKTGYLTNRMYRKKNGLKKLSLFSAPKDPYYFELWKRAIPRADRQLRSTDFVCEMHFRKEDINSYFEHKLPNGAVFRLFRGRKKLHPGVVPCIFPNAPGHSTFVGNKLTNPKKNSAKRKKISLSPNTQKESKKAKKSCPDNETNMKNDSSLQKENVLLEVIVVHPIPEKPSTTEPSCLKERQNAENEANSLLSDSLNQAMSDPESSASACSSPVPVEIAENHSKQSNCYKTLTESSKLENLSKNSFKETICIETITESSMPYAPTKHNSDQNICDITLTESTTCDTLLEKYPDQNISGITLTEPTTPDAIREKNFDQNICDSTLTESPIHDTLPVNFSDQTNYENLTEDSTANELTENYSDERICDKAMPESKNIESAVVEQVSFDFLKANVNMFEATDSWWRVNVFDDFIVFSRWTSDYTVEKRIVITKDLSVKVYLKDKEITLGSDLKELSIYDIAKLIYRVENLRICSDIDVKDRNCNGFLESVFMCKRYGLCLNCLKRRKEEKKKSKNCVKLLNFNLIT